MQPKLPSKISPLQLLKWPQFNESKISKIIQQTLKNDILCEFGDLNLGSDFIILWPTFQFIVYLFSLPSSYSFSSPPKSKQPPFVRRNHLCLCWKKISPIFFSISILKFWYFLSLQNWSELISRLPRALFFQLQRIDCLLCWFIILCKSCCNNIDFSRKTNGAKRKILFDGGAISRTTSKTYYSENDHHHHYQHAADYDLYFLNKIITSNYHENNATQILG